MPTLDRVRRRAAEDRHRQDPALQAARLITWHRADAVLVAAVATAAATVIFGLLWELGAPLAAVGVAPPSGGGGVAWLLLHRTLRRRRIAAREVPPARRGPPGRSL